MLVTEETLSAEHHSELCCGTTSNPSTAIGAFLEYSANRVDAALRRLLPPQTATPIRLHEAMHYVVFAKGKRIRPALVYALAELFRGQIVDQQALDAAACAVELMHAYSLVHDDLPAMDDDDLRRGQLTCHKQYDEPTAILVGDALQALAFAVIADYPAMVRELALASGSQGMVGGQALDLAAEGKSLTQSQLTELHGMKTGALIRASVALGACACGRDPSGATYAALKTYAENIGLAFQVQDDILDVEGDTEQLGKCAGQDERLQKSTYPKLLGLAEAKAFTAKLEAAGLAALSSISGNSTLLRNIAAFIIKRRY